MQINHKIHKHLLRSRLSPKPKPNHKSGLSCPYYYYYQIYKIIFPHSYTNKMLAHFALKIHKLPLMPLLKPESKSGLT